MQAKAELHTGLKKIYLQVLMVPVRHIDAGGPATDDELVKLFQQSGDQQVLATPFLRYTDLVYGTAMKYLKDSETSKDTVMNIYQELVQKLPRHPVENFKSWLYVVVKNHCLMLLRKEKKGITVEFQPNFMQSEDFTHLDSILDKEKELQKLENCIAALPEEQKKTIRMFYLQAKCYNEIVDLTGFDWNKVRSLVQNGRRNLKICMDKHE
jgi:RNA polymerase sigma factor (sigma-70 family)